MSNIDWNRPIETVPCPRNPDPVPCKVYLGKVVMQGRWIDPVGSNRHNYQLFVHPDGRLHESLMGAVRNVIPLDEDDQLFSPTVVEACTLIRRLLSITRELGHDGHSETYRAAQAFIRAFDQ